MQYSFNNHYKYYNYMYVYVNTTYVPVLICTVELDSPIPIQLTAEISMLYMTACFNPVIVLEFVFTLHCSSIHLKSESSFELILIT